MKDASGNGPVLIAPFAEGTALPLTFEPPSPAPPCEPKTVQKRPPAGRQRRSAEACRHGDAYVRETFRPGPTSRFSEPNGLSSKRWRQKLKTFFSSVLGDLEKEKRRLQNIMSAGQEEPVPGGPSGRGSEPDAEDGDRFQEGTNRSGKKISPVEALITETPRFSLAVLGEIEERRQFLADMTSLGQGKKYINIISTEISQVKPDSPTLGAIGAAVKVP